MVDVRDVSMHYCMPLYLPMNDLLVYVPLRVILSTEIYSTSSWRKYAGKGRPESHRNGFQPRAAYRLNFPTAKDSPSRALGERLPSIMSLESLENMFEMASVTLFLFPTISSVLFSEAKLCLLVLTLKACD